MKTFKQLKEEIQLNEAGRFAGTSRYSSAISKYNVGSHRPGIDIPNVNHKINDDGDHEFSGDHQHKIIKSDDHEGLKSHLENIHKNVLGQGYMFVAHSNKGRELHKMFNGGAPGVDALHKAVTAHSVSEQTDVEYDLDEALIDDLKKIPGAKVVSSKDKKASLMDKIAASKAKGATGNSTVFGGASRNKPFSYGSKID